MAVDEATMPRKQYRHSQSKIILARMMVLLLVWSQFALAAHQIDHSVTTLDESCAVCLQFERNDDALPSIDTPRVSPETSHAAVAEEPAASRSHTFTSYQSRASP